ncbi:MAG: DMT family transporter [Rhizobium sp.]|nr:DMT family transporter [Rhizobium sp.]
MANITSISSIIAAGGCFMLANLAMKLLADKPPHVFYLVVGAAILAGCFFQALAFKGAQFGIVVVLILGLEMVLSVLIARAFLGEIYSLTNFAGVLLVIVGMALVHVPAAARPEPVETTEPFTTVPIGKGPRLPSSVAAEAEPAERHDDTTGDQPPEGTRYSDKADAGRRD